MNLSLRQIGGFLIASLLVTAAADAQDERVVPGAWTALDPGVSSPSFLLELDRPAHFLILCRPATTGLDWRTLQGQRELAQGTRLSLKAGTFRLIPAGWPDVETSEPVFFQLLEVPPPPRSLRGTLRPGEVRAVFPLGDPPLVDFRRGRHDVVWAGTAPSPDSASLWLRPAPGANSWALPSDPRPFARLIWLADAAAPGPDPTEPNDDPAQAVDLQSGEPKRFALHPSGDRDWFRIRLSDAGRQRVRILAPSEAFEQLPGPLELGITNEDGQTLAQRISVPASPHVWSPPPFALPAGPVRLWVRARGGWSSREELRLLLEEGPPDFVARRVTPAEESVRILIAGPETLRDQAESLGLEWLPVSLDQPARPLRPEPERPRFWSWIPIVLIATGLLIFLARWFFPERPNRITTISG